MLRRGLFCLVLGMVSLFGLTKGEQPPLAVIQEFGQGRAGFGEWVEILVVGEGPGSTVDLRGWTVQDHQGDRRGGVFLLFKDHELWARVRAGTLIVIYNAGDTPNLPAHFPKDDLAPEDFLLVVPGRTGEHLEVRRWEGLANTGDCLFLVDAQGAVVFKLSYGNRQCAELHLAGVDRGQAAWFSGGSWEEMVDPAQWKVGPDAPGGSTPGAPNSEANAAWLSRLRSPPQE